MFAFLVSAKKCQTPRCFRFIGESVKKRFGPLSLIALVWILVNLSGTAYAAQVRAVIVNDEYPLPETLSLCGEPMPLQHRVRMAS